MNMAPHWPITVAFVIGTAALLASGRAATINDPNRWTSRDKILNAMKNAQSPGGTVELPTVELKGADIKRREVPVRDFTQRAAVTKREVETVQSPKVPLKRHDVPIHDTPVRLPPSSNFTAKRYVLADKTRPYPTKPYPVERAPIPARRIQINSPEGLEELREQLGRVP
ncbi:MAG: hypothetical protein N3B01_07010 [Verrucomicrobiae bacterium]|nr:hypothetical protein [Verrucomicrobiae bacterium]